MDFRSRLLAFLWASAEPLPSLPLRVRARLSRYPTGSVTFLAKFSNKVKVFTTFYEEVLSRITSPH